MDIKFSMVGVQIPSSTSNGRLMFTGSLNHFIRELQRPEMVLCLDNIRIVAL